MFGYIKPFKPQMRMCEYEMYKGVYCGLCGQLGKSFGAMARVTLSYDFTFLCILHYGVSGQRPSFSKGRCYMNPLKKITGVEADPVLSFGADTAAIMIYYKLLDNMQDEKGIKRLSWSALRPVVHGAFQKAAARQPECAALIASYMEQQGALEQARTASVDAACEPTARVMAGICRLLSREGEQQRVLERLGYCMGRFIYLCDALDDLEDDIAAKGYNPYALRYELTPHSTGEERKRVHSLARESLYDSIAEAAKAYQLLEVTAFAPIASNVLLLGMRASVDEILSGKESPQ